MPGPELVRHRPERRLIANKPNCKQAAALLIAIEDSVIDVSQEEALRRHILACKACTNFEQQLLVMRNAFKQWCNHSDETYPLPTG